MREALLPRFKLTTENRNYLLSWAMGMVQLASDESMEALFESMETERVYSIRGELIACRIMPVE